MYVCEFIPGKRGGFRVPIYLSFHWKMKKNDMHAEILGIL